MRPLRSRECHEHAHGNARSQLQTIRREQGLVGSMAGVVGERAKIVMVLVEETGVGSRGQLDPIPRSTREGGGGVRS